MTRGVALGATSAFILAAAFCAAVPKAFGQAAPAQPVAENSADSEEIIELDPFTVSSSDESSGYAVKDTLAGTRIRTEMKDVASSLSVINSQFLKDTGAKNTQDLLVYTTNTEVGGVRGNFSNLGGVEAPALLRPNTNTRVRGLDAADNTRDYFMTEIPWDSYNVDRVDMQRGPNSILFGVGSPAGIINASLNSASFKTGGKIENRYSKYDSIRTTLDYNHVLIKDQLAVRFAALDEDEHFQQDPAYQKSRRIYGALRFDPKLFGPDARTSIRVNYERGDIDANRPRSLPPVDAITQWFKTGTDSVTGFANMNKLTVDPTTDWTRLTANKEPQANGEVWPEGVAPWYGYAAMGRGANSNMELIYNSTSSAPINSQASVAGVAGGLNSAGQIDGTISGIQFGKAAAIAGLRNYYRYAGVLGAANYHDQSLTDNTIFDFYNLLMDGSNKSEYNRWDAANLAVSQTFFGDRLGFEYVYDMQRYEDGQVGFLNAGEYVLSIDINDKLLDGSDNPNVGRAYVGNSGQYGNTENYIDRDSHRFTAFGDLRFDDFFDKKSLLARILGHHVFTGLLSQDVKRTDYRNYARWATDPSFAAASSQTYDVMTGAAQVDWIAYLGGDMSGLSTASGAYLNNVSAVISPSATQSLRYFKPTWNAASNVGYNDEYIYTSYTNTDPAAGPIGGLVTTTGIQADNPANYVGWTTETFNVLSADRGDIDSLYTAGQKSRNKIESQGITWQGYFFDDLFVPVWGWRKDKVTNTSIQAPKGSGNVSLMNYSTSDAAAQTQKAEGESISYGAVLHTPKAWREKIGGTNISLIYNTSENFKADAPRGDLFGNQIANPSGDTEDYGIAITTLNDRLTLKVTHYETNVKDATLSSAAGAGFGNNLYYGWAIPYWGVTHALAALDGVADPQRRQGDWGWPWNGIATNADGTPDKARIYAIAQDFLTNFPLDQRFCDEYGLDLDVSKLHSSNESDWYAACPSYAGPGGPSGLGLQPAYAGSLGSFGSAPVATCDTTSKGWEVELTAQPIKQWTVSINASKTDAAYSAISPSIEAWINTMTEFLAGDAGLIKLWGGDTFRKNWNDNIVLPFNVLKSQIGQQAPEIAQWRFNLVNNYNFDSGFLKGANIGVAYRWEDKRVLGYGLDTAGNLDVALPLYGPTDEHFDVWVGYGRKLTSKIDWRIQLNLRNVGERTKLVPVSLNPDGQMALARIQAGMGWSITNTFSF
jgi:catechol 2,3-dioxygenase-like lactoylglutathione lyase family enzyme